MGMLEGEGSAAAGHRTKVGGVFEDLRLRHLTLDHLVMTHRIHSEHLAPAAVQIADDIPHVFVGDFNHDVHDRFKQGRLTFQDALLEAEGAGDFEGHFRRIDGMVRPVRQRNAEIDNRISRKNTLRHCLHDSLLDGRAVLLRNDPADDLVYELETTPPRKGLNIQPSVSELPASPGRFLVTSLDGRLALDGLLVGNLRGLEVDLESELPFHLFYGHFDVDLTES